MSICNVWLYDDKAFIAVDTACMSQPERTPGEFSKIHVISHLGAVIAFRGENQVALSVLFCALVTIAVRDFDHLVELMPEFFERAMAIQRQAGVPDGVNLTTEIFLVGWSASRARMAGVRFLFQSEEPLEVTDPDRFGGQLSPCRTQEESARAQRLPQDSEYLADDMKALMAAQIEFGRETHPQTAFGGRMLVAIATRYDIQVTDWGDLD